jgi:transcriptional regulator with XRE-family HTH domain
MTSIYKITKNQQEDAAKAFGAMLKRWRSMNGWTQYTAAEWSKEAGDFESSPHSGLSELENGHVKNPRSGTFIRLAEVNYRVHVADFHGVNSRKIKAELAVSVAILDEQGNPWGPAQFWECHAGLRTVPESFAPIPSLPMIPVPQISDDQAAELGCAWRQAIIDAGRARGLGAMKSAAEFLRLVPQQHRDAMEHGLMLDLTAADLAPMWDPEGRWLPTVWVATWLEG